MALQHTLPLLLALAMPLGCQSAPSQEELAQADFGQRPSDERINAAMAEIFASTLKDPESMQVGSKSQPVKAWFYNDGKRYYGWRVQASINARNSFGGYTGYKTWTFYFEGHNCIYTAPRE